MSRLLPSPSPPVLLSPRATTRSTATTTIIAQGATSSTTTTIRSTTVSAIRFAGDGIAYRQQRKSMYIGTIFGQERNGW